MGLIPARAGTTLRSIIGIHDLKAHPRSRGDHCCAARYRESRLGSSPLARGPLGFCVEERGGHGLIPARAGTTNIGVPYQLFRRAHPRSRGDHCAVRPVPNVDAGSSPLARGPRHGLRREKRTSGLIPARAGTTSRMLLRGGITRAHPRSRGDHMRSLTPLSSSSGSSPLARGPPGDRRGYSRPRGLIPARAGTTSSRPKLR